VTDTFMRKSPRSRVPCQTTTCTDTFEYDARDRLITEVRTRSGADVRRTSYELWDHGAVKWEHAPEGDFFHQYDGVRLDFVRGPGGTSYHHYDDDGNLDCVTLDADAPEACASATTDNPAGYTAYGEEDKTLTAESDPDQPEGSQTPPAAGEETNPFRFTGKRQDSSSETLDMGVRRFAPDVAAFAQPDLYENAFDNLDLAQDPLTANRYALAGGNPISFVEVDGHWPEFVDDAVDTVEDSAGDIGGALKDTGVSAANEVKGTAEWAYNSANFTNGDKFKETWSNTAETVEAIAKDPGQAGKNVVNSFVNPIKESYKKGGLDAAITRGLGEGAVAVIGGKGLTKMAASAEPAAPAAAAGGPGATRSSAARWCCSPAATRSRSSRSPRATRFLALDVGWVAHWDGGRITPYRDEG